MFGISVTSTPANCPGCGFSTKDDLGTCPKCGNRLMQAEELYERDNAFDYGKGVIVSSVLLFLYLLLSDNPFALRHLNDPRGILSSLIVMGCASGFITGSILMLLRKRSVLLTFGLLLVFATLLTVIDRLVLTSFV